MPCKARILQYLPCRPQNNHGSCAAGRHVRDPCRVKIGAYTEKTGDQKIIGIEKAGITYVLAGKSRIMTANANVTTNSKTSIDTAAGKSFHYKISLFSQAYAKAENAECRLKSAVREISALSLVFNIVIISCCYIAMPHLSAFLST